METDLKKIKELSKIKDDENWEFRAFLKWQDISTQEMDSIVHGLYNEVSREIDCRTCANCCKELHPVLDKSDIQRLSESMELPIAQFKKQYLIKDKDSRGSKFNKEPCPLLVNNQCSYYDHRPKECRLYPHLHKKNFTSRLIKVIDNCSVCPIVYNVFEKLKIRLSFYGNIGGDFYER